MLNFLESSFIGKQIIFKEEITSTNDYLLQNTDNLSFTNGCLVYANFQSNGKGYKSNVWQSQKGKNALFSIFLKPIFLPINNQFLLNKTVCIAIIDALNAFTNFNFKIKWPNDIYFDEKKIGGILIQNALQGDKIEKSIVGIGLNINQIIFNTNLPNPTSLKNIAKTSFVVESVIKAICLQIEVNYLKLKQNQISFLDEKYLKYLFGLQQKRTFVNHLKEKIEGKIIGVDEIGKLLIESNKEVLSFGFKEIEFLF